MGKNSLLESTSKKKPKAKSAKGKAAKKIAAKKSKAKAKPKSRAAKTTKKVAAKAAKAPAKVKKAAAKKKAPAKKKPVKKLSLKELRFKKFDTQAPKNLYTPPAQTPSGAGEAPSYFTGMSAAEATVAREALQRKFDWKAIKAAGEKYAAQMAAEAEAKRKAEEEAKRKAEEEAKRKAEEEAKRKAEEEAKRKAEEEAKRKAEEEAKRKAEEEAKRKAEEDAKRKAEEEAKRKAAEEAKRKAEEEAKRKAEAEAAAAPPTDSIAAELAANKPLKFGLIGFGVIVLLLIMSSYSNTKNYYITEKDGVITIERGTFTPMGTTVLLSVSGVPMPEPPQEVYGWQEAYRLMYQHYINAADKLLEAPGIPDTAALSAQLGLAVKYAPNRELRDDARSRLVGMRAQILMHKAQASLQRRTIEGALAAIEFLEEANRLDLSEGEVALVQERTAEAETILADLEAAKAEAERQAAEEAALAAEAEKLKATAANSQPAGTDAD